MTSLLKFLVYVLMVVPISCALLRDRKLKNYHEINNPFKRCLMAKWIRCLLCTLEIMCSIPHL